MSMGVLSEKHGERNPMLCVSSIVSWAAAWSKSKVETHLSTSIHLWLQCDQILQAPVALSSVILYPLKLSAKATPSLPKLILLFCNSNEKKKYKGYFHSLLRETMFQQCTLEYLWDRLIWSTSARE